MAILAEDPVRIFSHVMTSLFALQDVASEAEEVAQEEGEEDDSGEERPRRASRLEEKLRGSLGRREVLDRLRALAPELDKPTEDLYGAWLRRTLQETLAEALLQACIDTAPRQAATDSLVADLEEVDDSRGRVRVTETTLGGAGVIQAFAEAFSSEPRALHSSAPLKSALAPTGLELANEGLKEFVALVRNDPEVREITAKMRGTTDHNCRNALRCTLYEILGGKGHNAGHDFSVSLNARVLKSGTNSDWDAFLAMVLESWDELEARFSISIGVREMCFAALRRSPQRLRRPFSFTLPSSRCILWSPRRSEEERAGLSRTQ